MKNTGKTTTAGTLIMASNHIGNPSDISRRALEAVRDAELLVFEEDRPARATLKAAGIHRNYLKFNEHHQPSSLEEIRNTLAQGKKVLFMSDQGSPALADPGRHVSKLAYEIGAKVVVIPGPSSVTAALSAAPFEIKTFKYLGFPPREATVRKQFLKHHIDSGDNLVILDTPYRLYPLISELGQSHPRRKALLAIEISTERESIHFGKLRELKEFVTKEKLNFVLIVQGKKSFDGTKKGKSHLHER